MAPATPDQSFSPSMQSFSPSMQQQQQQVGSFGLTDVAGLFKEQQTFMAKQQVLLIERDAKVRVGLGHIIALQNRSSTSYQIR